ncbi:uncharacterized protein LOC143876052 [Tasmannia lanceolata]|uniref:uncharacterized protein LOC143876052 n=1 Tax=Tasmannia lanceolata TaxID=3420 RepID=UPI004062B1C0
MERLLKQYEREFMKMAMLKHEETFKEQVYELHRLYQIQKLLMNDMKGFGLKRPPISVRPHDYDSERWNSENEMSLQRVKYHNEDQKHPKRTIDLERPAEDYFARDDGDVMLQIEQDTDIELRLGWGCNQRKKEDMSYISDSGPRFASSSSSIDYSTIHQTDVRNSHRRNTREKLTGNDWGLIQIPDMNMSFQHEKNSFGIEEQLRQERLNQPPWMFHVLSLNMT